MTRSRPGEPTGVWLAPGTRLNDVYEIDEGIAAGGMGEIYRGHAIVTGDLVAIKTIRSDIAETDAVMTMFRKEAVALHNLYHEAIVRYYVFSVDPTLQRPYLAMEYVSGPSLSTMVRDGALGYEAVRELGARLASGLQAAHERGIIHRDISPDNVIVPESDVVQAKIIDFGIARQTRAGDGTVVGDGFAGKHNYVSPEQVGLYGGDVTGASDIYSLGLVLVEAVTGQAIDMRGSLAEVIEKRRKVPDLSGVDRRLRPLLERMLEPDPRDRPRSMTEVEARLRKGAAHRPVAGGRVPPEAAIVSAGSIAHDASAAGGTPASRLAVMVGALVLGVVVVGGGAYGLLASRALAPVLSGLLNPVLRVGEPPQARSTSAIAVTQITPDGGTVADAARISRFLDTHAEGDCAFVEPVVVADNRAVGEAMARTASALSDMRSDFRQALGFDLDLRVKEVAPAQCPLVTLVAETRAERALRPDLELVSYAVGSGAAISGAAFAPEGGNVGVVAAFADGTVRAVTAFRPPGKEGLPFDLAPDPQLAPPGRPVLLLAIASQASLQLLKPEATWQAADFVVQLRAEGREAGMPVAVSVAYAEIK